MVKKPYRLLILTASTGGGHDARADALAGWAREFYGEYVEVKIHKPLEGKKSAWGKFGVELYNAIQRWAPVLHSIYFHVIELIGAYQTKDSYFGKGEFDKLLQEFKPQMVVSLHDFLSRGYFEAAKAALGDRVRCATYCGEYSAGSGFSKHWVTLGADRWIGRTEGAMKMAVKLGLPADKVERFSFFLAPEEVEPIRMSARSLKKDLWLDPEKLTIFFASGRNGGVNHLKFLKALEPMKDKVQAIVVCGLNETMRKQIEQWQKATQFPMFLQGYSSQMRQYLQAADVMFFKGGSNTATKAFYEGCPVWFDASEGVMPQEQLTVDFFVQKGGGEVISSVAAFVERVEWSVRHRERLQSMRGRMQTMRETYLQPTPWMFFREFLAWGLERTSAAQTLRADEKTFV